MVDDLKTPDTSKVQKKDADVRMPEGVQRERDETPKSSYPGGMQNETQEPEVKNPPVTPAL